MRQIMGTSFFSLLVGLATLSLTLSQNTYFVTMPKTIRPNLVTRVFVQILRSSGPVNVLVSLVDNQNTTIVEQSDVVDSGVSTLIDLKIPSNLMPGKEYDMKVEGSGGLTFTNWTKLDFENKGSSIFIQTDRAMYKPGQTVRFRIFGMLPDLTTLDTPVNIEIHDPKKNKIQQWKGLSDINGVVTESMVMSDHPVLGDWKIKVMQGRETKEKTFTVAEYVLPKFEVKVTLPPFAVTTASFLPIKISAMYTFGKPVTGTGTYRIRRKYNMWWRRKDLPYADGIDRRFDISGEYETSISLSDIKMIDPSPVWTDFVVEANVTEGITGLRMNDSEEIMFYNTAEKIEFVSSLPNNYKPGLNYTAIVRVTQRDDSPIPFTTEMVNVSVSYQYKIPPEPTEPPTTTEATPPPPPTLPSENYTEANGTLLELRPIQEISFGRRDRFFHYPRYETVYMEPQYFTVPPDGLVSFDVLAPENATSVNIRARFKKETAFKDLDRSQSPSDTFTQVSLLDDKVKPGEIVRFNVKSTQKLGVINYQILSKGAVVKVGSFDMQQSMEGEFPVMITYDMAPKAKILIQYVRDDGEIVADGITFKVDGIFKNPVSINFDRRRAKPGEDVRVNLEALPYSQVSVLAVDKSVLLLKSGNDITEDEVTRELESYDTSSGGSFPGFWMWRWPISSGGQDASDVFENNGMVVLTDAVLYKHQREWNNDIMYDSPMPMMMRSAGAFDQRTAFRRKSAKPSADKLAEVKRVRTNFPETWLWESVASGATGQTELLVQVPDTITSWVATAFAVNKDHGLGLAPGPANLEVFLPFFIRLNMPYSVVRGELLVLQVDIFNYREPANQTEFTLVIMENNNDILNVISFAPGRFARYSTRIGRWNKVVSGSVSSAFFPIVPRKIGKLKVKINALGLKFADSVERELLVLPEGTPEEFNNAVLVDMKPGIPFSKRVAIDFPPHAVDGSRRARAAVIGDVMGPSINGIDKLLKMPYGCGEQNMLNFAPNIYIRRYLSGTSKLTPAIDAKSKEYMIKGYQREMTYQHKDGSFSAFGESDKSGTTWLTAFVVKSFAEASDVITIDEDALIKAVGWLVMQQNMNGTFNEPGKVLHKAMQGGSAAGENSLTAFVLIALLEAGNIPGVNETASKAVTKATTFLEDQVDMIMTNGDVYELAIMGYALSLAGSRKVDKVLELLDMQAVKKDGTLSWERPEEEKVEVYRGWRPAHVQSKGIDIELTSYVLMIFSRRRDTNNGLRILRWLTAQRNPEGGFSSTQDTITALQALGDLAGLIYKPNFNMRITLSSVSSDIFSHEFYVNPSNALMLQTVEIPESVREVYITAEGEGMALVEIATYFNVMDDLKTKAFDVNVTLSSESMTGFIVEVCGRWLKKGASGMSIIEIGYPSGMAPELDSLNVERSTDFKRMEMAARGLVLYYDEFTSKPQCVSIYMSRVDMVGEQRPAPIRIYDYYDKDKQATTFYTSTVLATADVCDICQGSNCFCDRI